MSFVIGVLTFLLVVNCLLLILLVLVQLPKKDAGAGIAFGGGTADALFGSGSGNVLTKITKYATGVFLGLSIVLGIMQSHLRNEGGAAGFTQLLQQKQQQAATTQPPAQSKPPVAAATNSFRLNTPATNAEAPAPAPTPVPAGTNSPK
jgi:protein translocase SecG subunit